MKFHLLNHAAHTLPPIVTTLWFYAATTSCGDTMASANLSTRVGSWQAGSWHAFHVPALSAAFHIAWALRVAGTLRLDRVYITRPPSHWALAWAMALVTHVLIGRAVWMRMRCSSS